MSQEKNYDGLLIGIVFTSASLLLTLIFFAPIISVLPGVFIESIAAKLVDNDPYSNVGKATITLLAIIFIITLILVLINVRRTVLSEGKISRIRIVIAMALMYFIIHPLGFYIYWGLALGYRSDGQLIFAAVDSVPKSSWVFILIGLTIDGVKNFKQGTVSSLKGKI